MKLQDKKRIKKSNTEEFRKRHIKGKENSTHYYSENIKKLMSFRTVESSVKQRNIKQKDIKMTNQNVLRRDWLKYSKSIDKDSYNDMNNKCVYSLLVKFLKPVWTKVNEDKLIEYFKENCEEAFYEPIVIYDTESENYSNYVPPTYSSEVCYSDDDEENNENSIYYKNETIIENVKPKYIPLEERGVSTSMISKLCLDKNITMYAFNQDDKCFLCNRKNLIQAGKNRLWAY